MTASITHNSCNASAPIRDFKELLCSTG
jgi:hypothetical protein